MTIDITPQPTPNPNALKFNVSRKVVEEGSRSFTSRDSARDDPIASQLFELDGVVQVFMLNDFITINKSPDADWDLIEPEAIRIIRTGLS